MPTKMHHLEFAPQFVHVAFSPEHFRVNIGSQTLPEMESVDISATDQLSGTEQTDRSH